MSNRVALYRASIVGIFLCGAALISTSAFAQEGCCTGGSATGANAFSTGIETSAYWPTTAVEPVQGWWTHGDIEVGGRDFDNNPTQHGNLFGNSVGGGYFYLGQKSLGKYYEYSDVKPGAFGGGHVATGSKDGLYQVDIWANNVGYDDQSYMLKASKAGEQYFNFTWDQSPHTYSTNALTPFNGIGGNFLTAPVTTPATTAGLIPFLHQINLGIQRDTAAVGYRWTPTDDWDFNADYSHMDRTGTQAAGVVELSGFNGFQVPAPVNDTTQNYKANGEYVGTSPWGKQFSVKLGYNGSSYTDHLDSYFVQNPFFPTVGSCVAPKVTAPVAAGTANCFAAQMGTPPSNQANGFAGTVAADLPMMSRYVGTFNFTQMSQNQTFQPMTDNPLAVASPTAGGYFGGIPWNQVNFGYINGNPGDPTSSLNGLINTYTSNNVLTTKITPELTSKLTYRYYDFDNESPHIVFPCWISYDQTGAPVTGGANNPCGGSTAAGTGFEDTIGSLSVSYVKQNATAALNWRPSKEWNFNAEYNYESYSWSQADASGTKQNGGKLSADWSPASWFTVRSSGAYSERRFDSYNYQGFVVPVQFPNIPPYTPQSGSYEYASAYQQFMLDNRNRTQANLAIDLVLVRGLTFSPSLKYQDDYYGLNPLTQEGVTDQKMLGTGVDVAYVPRPDLSIVLTYYWDNYNQLLYSSSNAAAYTPFTNGPVLTSDKEHVSTFTAAVNWAAIPDRLDLVARYTMSDGINSMLCGGGQIQCVNTNGTVAFPNVTTLLQRIDATAIYKFDPTWVSAMGWKGDIKAKLNYTWERNAVNNWQQDTLAFLTPAVSATAFYMGYDNPNYNVQMLAASLIATW